MSTNEKTERNEYIVNEYTKAKNPKTMAALAKELGITRQRIFQVLRHAEIDDEFEDRREAALQKRIDVLMSKSSIDSIQKLADELGMTRNTAMRALRRNSHAKQYHTMLKSRRQSNTRQAILDGIMAYYKRHGHRPSTTELFYKNVRESEGLPSLQQMHRYFTSIENVCEELGIPSELPAKKK